tara:strand:+ start:3046 stop:4290 length:1245 start_codon:yes stop_codon:yes gene_type:complete
MNILLFASDEKYFNYLVNVHKELVNRKHNSLFLYTKHPITCFDISKYSYDYKEEIDLSKGYKSNSLFDLHLPFKPDIVLLARERWQPEQNIIKEFKEIFNSKIALLEINSNFKLVIEEILEIHSRNQYPQNMCDLYLDHSNFTVDNKIKTSFKNGDKSIITGNPKYDNLEDYKLTPEVNNYLNEKYQLDPNKEKVLWFSHIDLTRDKCLDYLEKFYNINKHKYEILYKAFPGEPYNPRYSKQFQVIDGKIQFYLPGVKPFTNDTDLFYLSQMCDIHLGTVSSVSYFSFILNKKFINIGNKEVYDKGTDINTLFEKNSDIASGETGIAAEFWCRVFNINQQELIDVINLKRLEEFKIINDEILKIFEECTIPYDDKFLFLNKKPPNPKKLLDLYDNFNDFKASKRIVNNLENLVL